MPALGMVASLTGALAHLVVQPSDPTASADMFLLLPGAGVQVDHYEATARGIQAASRRLSKQEPWVVIPNGECSLDTVGAALAAADAQGFQPASDSAWLAGHAEGGGACMEILSPFIDSKGLLFLGARPSDAFKLEAERPALVLGAELDGGKARPGRLSSWFARLGGSQNSVAILPKQNSSSFCPGFDLAEDLLGEVPQDVATANIGDAVVAFMHPDGSGSTLAVDYAQRLLTPFMRALHLEHLPDGGVDVNGSSPFCQTAQRVIAGLSPEDDARLVLRDQYSPRASYTTNVTDPTGTLKHCHGDDATAATDPTPTGELVAKICSYAGYNGSFSSTGRYKDYDGEAAAEIGLKMYSHDFIAEKLEAEPRELNTTCLDVNKRAVEIAQGLVLPETLDRYRSRGRGLCLLDDIAVYMNIGPFFIIGSVNYTETPDCLEVSGFRLKLELDETAGGIQYCKLMSPAFVLDWMMTGSLKSFVPADPVVV